MMTRILIALLSILSFNSYTQWNIDPTINTPVCTETGKQIDPRILEDGQGGAFVVWKDFRNTLPDVYIQRIDKNGIVKWAVDGVGACTDEEDQSTPNICSDGEGGCIVSWSDVRDGLERDLYAQRLDSNGNILWAINGVIVTNKPNREHNQKIVSDNSGGAIVVWEQEESNGDWDEWAQRINASGQIVWPPGGIALSTVVSNKINGRIESDGFGGSFIVWQDFRNGLDYDIYAQHLDGNGSRLWGNNAKLICNAVGTQSSPKIEPDILSGGFYTIWIDARNNNNDVYGQRIDASGNLTWANNGLSICTESQNQSAVDILTDATIDGIICTWKDFRSLNNDIYAQRINPSGLVQWAPNGVIICSNTFDQLNPNIATDLTGGAIITWQDSLNGNFDIRAQRITNAGDLLWNIGGEIVANASENQTSVKNCTDGGTGSIFIFMDKRSGTNDIYAHHFYGSGLPYSELTSNLEDVVSIFPNPFENELVINALVNERLEFRIQTIDGTIVYEGNTGNGESLKLKLGVLASGMYQFTILSKNRFYTKKLVKL